jgi:hypothetical protein
MFIPGVRLGGTSYCASFSGRDLDSLVARTVASVIVDDCNLFYRRKRVIFILRRPVVTVMLCVFPRRPVILY